MGLNENSELFRKYVVEVVIDSISYYTVSGADKEDQEEPDKVLVNEFNRLLLFKSVAELIIYVSRSDYLFDKQNFRAWAETINNDEKPYNIIKFDLLKNVTVATLLDKEQYGILVGTLYFIQDFAIQVEHEHLHDLLSSKEIIDVKDNYMEKYVFRGNGGNRNDFSFENDLVEDTRVRIKEIDALIRQRIMIM